MHSSPRRSTQTRLLAWQAPKQGDHDALEDTQCPDRRGGERHHDDGRRTWLGGSRRQPRPRGPHARLADSRANGPCPNVGGRWRRRWMMAYQRIWAAVVAVWA